MAYYEPFILLCNEPFRRAYKKNVEESIKARRELHVWRQTGSDVAFFHPNTGIV